MKTFKGVGSIFFTDAVKTTSVDKVRDALEKSELDTELASDLAKRFCFSRAKNRLDADGLIEEVSDNESKWVFQLSLRYKQDNKLTYEFEAQFWFDKKTQQVGADNEPLLNKVNQLFANYGLVYLPSDVSKMICRTFNRQNGMVSLRHHGVVYFVPSENNELMLKVSKFIDLIGAKCFTVPIQQESKEVVAQVETSLVENVQNELQKIVDEMATLKEKGEGFTSRKANTRWRQLTGQLNRVKMFARSLSVDTATLLNRIKTTEFDLALVTADNIDVIAALAQSGRINNVMGELAKVAFDGELPPINSPRVKEIADTLPELEMPVITNVKLKAKKEEAELVEMDK